MQVIKVTKDWGGWGAPTMIKGGFDKPMDNGANLVVKPRLWCWRCTYPIAKGMPGWVGVWYRFCIGAQEVLIPQV